MFGGDGMKNVLWLLIGIVIGGAAAYAYTKWKEKQGVK